MGQLADNLTNPNTALLNPAGQATFVGTPQQVLSRANAALPTASQLLGPDVLHPRTSEDQAAMTANLPTIGRPPFLQAASTGPGGTPNGLSPGLSKGGKLLLFLKSGLEGALAGRGAQEQMIAESGGHRAGGIGTGFQAGFGLPFLRAGQAQQVERGGLENEALRAQTQFYPQLTFLGAQKTVAETQKNIAEAGKAGAEAAAIPTKQALEQAQTEAANFKEDPLSGLIDLRTKQPISASASAPLSPDEAAILGKQPGERVPLKLKNTANEIANRGIRSVQAGGRSLLVDGKGNTIADMGASTPVVVNQLGLSQFGQKKGIEAADKQYDTAMGADERLDRMEQAYKKALGGDQQAMLSLLTDHIGMTLGLQKGARITKDIINEAQESQPWLAKLVSKFDDRGYLSGVTLSPEQMRQMLDLGYEARNRSWQAAFNTSQLYGAAEPPNARAVYNKRDPNSRVYQQSDKRPPLSSFEH